MEKEFNIFGEFESVEKQYLDSLKDDTLFVNPPSDDEDDDLDEIIATKTKEAKQLADDKTPEKSEDESLEDEPEDENEIEDTVENKPKSKESDEDDEDESEGGYSFKALANVLAEEGVIDYEDSEEDEDSIDVISKAVVNTAKNMLSEYKESLPDEGKKFLDYLEKGGDPSKYIEKISTTSVLDLDIEDESNQKRIITEYLKKSEFDDDEIKEMLEDYEDGLILEKQAKIAAKKLEKIYAKEKEALIARQEQEIKQREEQYKQHIKSIEDTIDNSNDIAGINISKADKKALKSYLLDTDKSGSTQWAKDLKEGGVKSQLALAYLQMKKFNLDQLKKEAATKVTKKYKDIFDNKNTTVKGRSKSVEETDAGDISAFRSFLK